MCKEFCLGYGATVCGIANILDNQVIIETELGHLGVTGDTVDMTLGPLVQQTFVHPVYKSSACLFPVNDQPLPLSAFPINASL